RIDLATRSTLGGLPENAAMLREDLVVLLPELFEQPCSAFDVGEEKAPLLAEAPVTGDVTLFVNVGQGGLVRCRSPILDLTPGLRGTRGFAARYRFRAEHDPARELERAEDAGAVAEGWGDEVVVEGSVELRRVDVARK